MAQQIFTPATDGSSTHLDARNVFNYNANDAENRLSALESVTGIGGGGSGIQPGDNVSLLVNDTGYLTDAVQSGDNVSLLVNDAAYLTDAVQSGDNVSLLVNDTGYLTDAVQSGDNISLLVNDAGYISSPTLDEVTDNGNTTTNDVTLGRITSVTNTATGIATNSIGGFNNDANGNNSAVYGGVNNIAGGARSVVVGGSNNSATGSDSEILGGTNSSATNAFCTIVGGHMLSAVGDSSAAIGGISTESAGTHSVTVGGNLNTCSGNYSSIIAGQDNKILNGHNRSVVIGGIGLVSDAQNTVYVPNLKVRDDFIIPTGATAGYVLTSDANGVGTWQAPTGGGGGGGTSLSGTTANNTQTEIFVDGVASSRMTLTANTTWMFSAMVAARSATESAGYKIEGVIKNDAGTTALVGTAVKTVFGEDDSAWDATVEADDTNDALVFKVIGDTVDSVNWEVIVDKVEAS